ncbi:hypothetical protein Pint_31018 [Pistacia integerrima]|uniref:Uncharacterized protein n=1 Tax=Pistacia integerrima TaxID=434235 RepID=A0ACC0XRE5_9ROSI|nr:hypothetical protein Pint_31018 [Pistacia integerrima]
MRGKATADKTYKVERCASRMMVNDVGTLYLQAKAAAIDIMPYRIFHFRISLPCSDTFYISVYEKWQSTCAYFDLAAGVLMTGSRQYHFAVGSFLIVS